MTDPATFIISTKNLIYSLLALFVTNVMGWKLFAKSKLDQMKDHEERLRIIEKNYPGIKYLNDLGATVNGKLDSMNEIQESQYAKINKRIDDIYNILLRSKHWN